MKRGDRFIHRYWLDPSFGYDKKVPALCEITKTTKHAVYYRWVVTYMPTARQELSGNSMWVDKGKFEKSVLRWVDHNFNPYLQEGIWQTYKLEVGK